MTEEDQRAEGLRQSIVALYQRVNPAALTELPGVFTRYRGREPELWSTVCRKYGHDPTDKASLMALPAGALAAEQPQSAAIAAQPGKLSSSSSAREVRRSMTLEHVEVAPPPSPELRSWRPPVSQPGTAVPDAAAADSPQTASKIAKSDSIQKINVRLSREIPTSSAAPASRRHIDLPDKDGGFVGADDSVVSQTDKLLQGQEQEDHRTGGSMILGTSMARWMTREATAAVHDNITRQSGGHLRNSVAIDAVTAVGESFGEGKMSPAEAAAAAARAPAVPTSPIHSSIGSERSGRISPYTQRSSLSQANDVDVSTAAVNSSNKAQRSLPKRLDPGSPRRPPPGRMAYTGPKRHGTTATIAAAAKADRENAAARVVQRAWSRWSLRANERAKKWKKELELLRWRITVLRRDGEDLAAQELETKLREVLSTIDSVKLRELERGDPKRRGGVSAFGTERLDPWHRRVTSPTESGCAEKDESGALFSDAEEHQGHRQGKEKRYRTRSRRRGQNFSDEGTQDDSDRETAYESDESHESWRSWQDEGTAAAQQRLAVQHPEEHRETASEPRRHRAQSSQESTFATRRRYPAQRDQRPTARRQAASEGTAVRHAGKSGRSLDRAVGDVPDYSLGDADKSLCRALPFSDDEDDRESDEDYYYNAHDSDIHEFASQLGSFLGGATRDETNGLENDFSWHSERTEGEPSGKECLGSLDLSPTEQVRVNRNSDRGTVGSDALMLALQSLEQEIGVGNKSSFR